MAVAGGGDSRYSLWTMAANGSGQREVPISSGDSGAGDLQDLTPLKAPVWSPDMASLAWARDIAESAYAGQVTTQVLLTDIDSGETRVLYETRPVGGKPPTLLRPSQWAADATKLLCGAFALSVGASHVFAGSAGTTVLEVAGTGGRARSGSVRVLDTELYSSCAPVVVWSPSGALVAYAVKPGALAVGGSEEPAPLPILSVARPDGSDRRALTAPKGTVEMISFSPDDAYLVYDSVDLERPDLGTIWIQAADGSLRRKLVLGGQMPSWRPAATP